MNSITIVGRAVAEPSARGKRPVYVIPVQDGKVTFEVMTIDASMSDVQAGELLSVVGTILQDGKAHAATGVKALAIQRLDG